jgi:hypothetical protein
MATAGSTSMYVDIKFDSNAEKTFNKINGLSKGFVEIMHRAISHYAVAAQSIYYSLMTTRIGYGVFKQSYDLLKVQNEVNETAVLLSKFQKLYGDEFDRTIKGMYELGREGKININEYIKGLYNASRSVKSFPESTALSENAVLFKTALRDTVEYKDALELLVNAYKKLGSEVAYDSSFIDKLVFSIYQGNLSFGELNDSFKELSTSFKITGQSSGSFLSSLMYFKSQGMSVTDITRGYSESLDVLSSTSVPSFLKTYGNLYEAFKSSKEEFTSSSKGIEDLMKVYLTVDKYIGANSSLFTVLGDPDSTRSRILEFVTNLFGTEGAKLYTKAVEKSIYDIDLDIKEGVVNAQYVLSNTILKGSERISKKMVDEYIKSFQFLVSSFKNRLYSSMGPTADALYKLFGKIFFVFDKIVSLFERINEIPGIPTFLAFIVALTGSILILGGAFVTLVLGSYMFVSSFGMFNAMWKGFKALRLKNEISGISSVLGDFGKDFLKISKMGGITSGTMTNLVSGLRGKGFSDRAIQGWVSAGELALGDLGGGRITDRESLKEISNNVDDEIKNRLGTRGSGRKIPKFFDIEQSGFLKGFKKFSLIFGKFSFSLAGFLTKIPYIGAGLSAIINPFTLAIIVLVFFITKLVKYWDEFTSGFKESFVGFEPLIDSFQELVGVFGITSSKGEYVRALFISLGNVVAFFVNVVVLAVTGLIKLISSLVWIYQFVTNWGSTDKPFFSPPPSIKLETSSSKNDTDRIVNAINNNNKPVNVTSTIGDEVFQKFTFNANSNAYRDLQIRGGLG